MLYTNLKHIENAAEHERVLQENEHVIVTLGRMDHRCISVFRMMEELEITYPQVKFYDMEYDNPESKVIGSLPGINSSQIPLVICYKYGQVVQTLAAVQSKEEIIRLLDREFIPISVINKN